MDFEKYNRTFALTLEWNAEFVFLYEVRMCTDGWGLVLHGPDGKKIDYFQDFIASSCNDPVKDADEDLMRGLCLSDSREYLTVKTPFDGDWGVDLFTSQIFDANGAEVINKKQVGDASLCQIQQTSIIESPTNRSNKGACCFRLLLVIVGLALAVKFIWAILHGM